MMLIVVMLALSQAIMSMRNMINYTYYSQLAEESAEAGTIYAEACLDANIHDQPWTTAKPLTQSSDCSGNLVYGASTTGGVNASIPIRFTLGNTSLAPFGANITALGSATMPGASSAITGTLNRSITWLTDLMSQASASGTYRTCGVLSGNVYCWGKNDYGQLGNNTTTDSLIPVKVYKETGVLAGKLAKTIFAAQYHNCIIAEGAVYCWGLNNYGQLGNGTTANSSKPIKVGGALAGKTVTAIGGTGYTSCAVADGKIYCWGYNEEGTVGNKTSTTKYTTPVAVATAADGVSNGLPATYTATMLTSGSRSTNMCAIADGKAYCWGPNDAGQIGNNSTTDVRAPTAVSTSGVLSGKTVTAISQDGYSVETGQTPPPYVHVCAVANGSVYCWGDNTHGQLGNNSTSNTKVPVAVSTSGVLSGKTMVDVELGLFHSCALSSDGKVFCWGENSDGQLGDNTTTDRKVPVAVYEEKGILKDAFVNAISAGANRGCATTNGKTFCWGHNNAGQIGDGTTTDRKKPTESKFLRPDKVNDFIY